MSKHQTGENFKTQVHVQDTIYTLLQYKIIENHCQNSCSPLNRTNGRVENRQG